MNNTLNYPNWSSPKKVKARNETIVTMYQSIFNSKSIPKEKQYWTMCGQNAEDNGTIRKDCEYNHIISTNLITPNQFYGVEKNTNIHNVNKQICNEAHWINNDFYNAIISEDNKNNFNPAIVNVDHVKMPHSGGIDYIARVLYLTDKIANNVMIVGNLILQCYSHKEDYKELAELLYKHRLYQSVKSRWNIHGYAYVYEGSNKNKTTEMGSIILWKN